MSLENASASLIGVVLHDSYHITRKIAAGGMGAIYEANHVRLKHKRFAIKLLHPSVAQVEEMYARFRREAEIATQLGHPNIINVLDFNETADGQPYLVMEFLEGQDLGVQLKRPNWLTYERITQIVNETASALQAAHDAGVVHRDVKPANIFLAQQTPDGPFMVKVLDFGISKIQRSQSIVTKANSIMGSINYMSPEQASGMVDEIDQRTDIYALGAICYQMLSGEVPFLATNLAEKLQQIISLAPSPLSKVRPDIPAAVSDVIARSLAKRKQDRYDQVSDFAKDLSLALTLEPTVGSDDELLQQLTQGALSPSSSVPSPGSDGRALRPASSKSHSTAEGPRALDLSAQETLIERPGQGSAPNELPAPSLADAPTMFKFSERPLLEALAAEKENELPRRRWPLWLAGVLVAGLALAGGGVWLSRGVQADKEQTQRLEEAARREVQEAISKDAAVYPPREKQQLAAAPGQGKDAASPDSGVFADLSAALAQANSSSPDAADLSAGAAERGKRPQPSPAAAPRERVVRKTVLSVAALAAGRPVVADVLINGRSLGQTPLYQEDLPPGAHLLEVQLEGYVAKKLRVRLRPGRPERVVISLEKSPLGKTPAPRHQPKRQQPRSSEPGKLPPKRVGSKTLDF